MAARTARKQKVPCGYCNAYIDKDQYGDHVFNCRKSDEEEESQPVMKVCPFCGKQVKDLTKHCQVCSDENHGTNDTQKSRQKSPILPVRHQPKPNIPSQKSTKKCPTCSETIDADDFADHMDHCDDRRQRRSPVKKTKKCPTCSETIDMDDFADHMDRCDDRRQQRSPAKKTKKCPTCSETIDVDDFADHMDHCDDRRQRRSPAKKTRKCPTCSETIDVDDFADHMDRCDDRRRQRSPVKKTKKCPTCSETIDVDDFADHMDHCDDRRQRKLPVKKTKKCPTCSETIDVDDFADHMDRCDDRQQRRLPVKKTKKCPTCSETIDVDDFADHMDHCDDRRQRRLPVKKTRKCPTCSETIDVDNFVDHMDHCDDRRQRRSPVKKTKECPTCSETIDVDDFADHMDRCDDRRQRRSPVKKTKKCPTCSETIDVDDFADHMDRCDDTRRRRSPVKKTKKCPTCSETIDVDDFANHIDRCDDRRRRRSLVKKTKKCPTCWETIDVDDFAYHMDRCDDRRRPRSPVQNTKRCPTCSETIDMDDFADHAYSCSTNSSRKQVTRKNTEECPVCLKEINKAEYEKHVNACYDKSYVRAPKIVPKSCFTCSSPVDTSKTRSHTIPCGTQHIYCLKCLQGSMNQYIESNTAPVCHSTLCDYELSRYDVSCLPIQEDMIKRLLAIVKSTQRPQCPLCHFYVDFKTMEDFHKHAGSCNSEDMIPCDHCYCLYNMRRLDDHTRLCRNNSPSERQQALIDFILPRTKYPVTPQQVRVFLEHRKRSRLLLDPHSVVDALAEFGKTFPFDVPTRDCDICAESYVYEDIYVFGCEESHKTCYVCFANSCTTKMSANQVLTCTMCAYQLLDGEIKQLRVPADQKRIFLDYQTQKTFGSYVGGTEGVIRCPNQKCKWVAEAQNPNDRFQVECPQCGSQFCSLCNQQYHFRTTCQQIPEITQRWFFWCNTERGNYWQARAQQDANFRAQLEDYERQTAANIQRNEELRQRYNDLLADENYKAQNCRLCPNCRRVVQHLSGCDLMVCGRNYHGGDQQSGCGHGFNWSAALPYAPIGDAGPQQVRTDMPAPEQQKTVVHEGVQCDACHNDVQGIRFDCVHCSSLIFCEKCEQRATLEHSNQIRDQNKQQHVFQIITRPLDADN